MEKALQTVQHQGARDETRAALDRLVEAGHPDAPVILEALFQGDRVTMNLPQAARGLDRWVAVAPDAWRPRHLSGPSCPNRSPTSPRPGPITARFST